MDGGQDFTSEELDLIARAAVLSGATVAIAKYSGSGGTQAEFQAILEGLKQAAQHYPSNPLLQALLTGQARTEVEQLAPRFRNDPKQRTFEDFKLAALNRASEASELLDRKATPEQAAEVRQGILLMCRLVAERSKEGSFLGLGGTPMDPMEQAVIDQITRTWGVTA
jgi:hypothetical protein